MVLAFFDSFPTVCWLCCQFTSSVCESVFFLVKMVFVYALSAIFLVTQDVFIVVSLTLENLISQNIAQSLCQQFLTAFILFGSVVSYTSIVVLVAAC